MSFFSFAGSSARDMMAVRLLLLLLQCASTGQKRRNETDERSIDKNVSYRQQKIFHLNMHIAAVQHIILVYSSRSLYCTGIAVQHDHSSQACLSSSTKRAMGEVGLAWLIWPSLPPGADYKRAAAAGSSSSTQSCLPPTGKNGGTTSIILLSMSKFSSSTFLGR